MDKEVKLIIGKDGLADLYFDDVHVSRVGRCSGMEETLSIFNTYMKAHGNVYRLSAKYHDMIIFGQEDPPAPTPAKKYRSIDDA